MIEIKDISGNVLMTVNSNLRDADLRGADLQNANLQDADLQDTNLQDANLRGADLQDANLQDANLQGANLQDANLYNTTLPIYNIVPENDSFIGYKKIKDCLITLLIPENAKRTSNLVGRKCRAEFVEVLEILDLTSKESISHVKGGYACRTYIKGEFVYPDSFDDDIRIECTHGIHFFITKQEAIDYKL